jgi:hypothetical protein
MSEPMVRQYLHGEKIRYTGTNSIFKSYLGQWHAVEWTSDSWDTHFFDPAKTVMVVTAHYWALNVVSRADVWFMELADTEPME